MQRHCLNFGKTLVQRLCQLENGKGIRICD